METNKKIEVIPDVEFLYANQEIINSTFHL